MKITAIKGFPVKVGHRNEFVVKIETDAGIYGLGEGGISGHELAMHGMLEHFAASWSGRTRAGSSTSGRPVYRGAYFEGGKILAATLSAIDIALWDILGQSLGVPVYQLLGGACRQQRPLLRHARPLTGPEVVEQAKDLRRQAGGCCASAPACQRAGLDGARRRDVTSRWKSLELAAHWLREVRKAVGAGHRALDRLPPSPLGRGDRALLPQGRRSEPLLHGGADPVREPEAYQQLRAMTPIPFAIGEEFSSKWAFAPFIEEDLTNFARIDVSNVGGLTEAKKVAGWCETHYIDMMPHNPLGPVTTAASIHFAAACPNFAYLEYQHRLATPIRRISSRPCRSWTATSSRCRPRPVWA